ncbi:HAD hydrolase-like protein [Marivita sp. S6314]|uniref:HAD-IIA family hydrolase n=1 Tax=Marivita sp. S6314 TaxID=2926406 RepID=UPI001FF3224F|nr:HAD hydrolase-like protein [Marivita sp. S6314]MCK0149468.1 HAD hydrolase-like protein [Marivita sp. S6314]
MTVDQAFAEYEAVRDVLPDVASARAEPVYRETLADLSDEFDVFLLDAFGVLNIGERAIPDVQGRVEDLIAAGKTVLVVSNAASVPLSSLVTKYRRLGYPFGPVDIVTSRQSLTTALGTQDDRLWGVMGGDADGLEDLGPVRTIQLLDDPDAYHAAEGFLLIGSATWTEDRQARLEAALAAQPRPVLVGNPDIVAPRETGFSVEPGYFAHRLAKTTPVSPQFFGKPYPNIYDLAFARLGDVDKSRVVMVGDSLHTDILGAHAAGIASALIAGYGFFAESDVPSAIKASGIAPSYVLTRP